MTLKSISIKASFVGAIAFISLAPAAISQPIAPANDGTGTVVTPEGDRIDIHGGQLSGDGANLFHSFEQFGLSEGQIANFLSNPNLENILGRVVGGDASYINGLLQVSGGDSNLFLINPNGIVFGASASLNVGGDFTATTATGIGFGENELDVFGDNSWSSLMGNPDALSFATVNPGSIVNQGNLAVESGQNLGLFGGSVVNTGTLSTSDGNITLMAVEGGSLVRLSAAGNVLSLDVAEAGIGSEDFTPLSLPQLLAGGEDLSHASQIAVNDDGTVSLLGSDVEINPQPGTAIASGELTANGDASTIQVLGNQVAVLDATLDVSGVEGGGNIFIGGDFQGNGTIPNARVTFVDRNTNIFADALQQGDGGRVILWADDTTAFLGNINARGATVSSSNILSEDLPFPNSEFRTPNSNGGFVEVSGKQNLIFDGMVDLSAPGGNLGTLLLDPTNITISNDPTEPATVDGFLPQILAGDFDGEDITINAATLASQTGNILLEATNDITLASGVSLNFAAGGTIAFTADSDNDNSGAFTMNSGSSIDTNGRSLTILAGDDITTRDITTVGGEITLTSNNGAINTRAGTIDTTGSPVAGAVTLSASGDIFTGEISADGPTGGNITLNSSNGGIDTTFGILNASGGSGGNIDLDAELDIVTVDITAGGGSGGQLDLNSRSGSIDTTAGTLSTSGGVGGAINFLAGDDIATGDLRTTGGGPGGNITLEAIDGNIDTRQGTLNSTSTGVIGGNVTLTATRNVFTGPIDASGSIADGNISITAQTGSIDVQNLTIADGGTDDPFAPPPSNPTTDADFVSALTGNVQLEAHNDITVNEAIVSSTLSSLAFKAGRNIFINADIDTSGGNGDITLLANDTDLDPTRRDTGTGSIIQAAGTSINAGSGNIFVELGTQGDVGEILLPDINTTGSVSVNSNGGVSLASGNPLNIGDISISGEGDLSVFADGDLSVTGNIDLQGGTTGNVNLESTGAIDTTMGTLSMSAGNPGDFNLIADGDITTGNLSIGGGLGGNISIESRMSNIDTSAGAITSLGATQGDLTLTAEGDITTGEVSTSGGNVVIESLLGNLDSTAGTVSSQGFPSGEVRLMADGDIASADVETTGANIAIESTNGEVDTSAGAAIAKAPNSGGNSINNGDVTIDASGQITTGNITAVGAAIRLTSQDQINTTAGELNVGGDNPGEIVLMANEDIAVANINLSGFSNEGGSLTITSQNGGIDASAGTIEIEGFTGAGSSTLSAAGNIRTGDISGSSGEGNGGLISLTSSGGSVTTGELSTSSAQQSAGNVTVNANGSISTQSISSNGNLRGGDVSLNSTQGSISTNGGTLDTLSDNGNAGSVTVTAAGSVATGNITSRSQTGTGGEVRVTSTNGNITTGDIETFTNANGDGGSVTLESNIAADSSITIGNLRTESGSGTGGDVALTAFTNVTASDITTFSSLDSGDIDVQIIDGNNGAIAIGNITTETTTGISGDITINGFDIDAGNISSIGSTGSGNIAIDAGGTITTLDISTITETGDSGNVDVDATGDIQTGDITSTGGDNSGDIEVTSGEGSVTTGDITSEAATGTAGDITVEASGDVNTGDIVSVGGEATGDIGIETQEGEVNTGELTTETGDVTINGEVVGEIEESLPPIEIEEEPNNRIPTEQVNNAPILQLPENNDTPIAIVTEDVQDVVETIARDSSLNPAIASNIETANKIHRDRSSSNDAADETGERGDSEELANFNILPEPSVGIDVGDVASIEQQRTNEYAEYFGEGSSNGEISIANTKAALAQIADLTGNQSAVVYVTLLPEQIELVLFTPEGVPIRQVVPNVSKEEVLGRARELRRLITTARYRHSDVYLESAQQLYQWLIAPLSEELAAAQTDTLLFSMDEGLRTLPIAALHDGKQFLVENYSFSLIPSLSLIDTRYRPLQNTQALGMGASKFADLNPLPAVPVELLAITQDIWQGDAFLNEHFTRQNLIAQRQELFYPIVHLATHGEFKAGDPSNSYIQLWDEKLRLDELRQLGWNNPAVELLVLSACRTAVGDTDAELGFAGLAVAAGVKSALASLWYVSDEGTLALMTEFYDYLSDSKIKAEALQQAQIAMIRGEVRVEGGQLRGSGIRGSIPLPPELANVENTNLSHPYYWSAFTTIGSPW